MTNETINKILNELSRVEHILITIRDTGKVSDIERDIIMAKLRTMYEFIQFIQPEEVELVKQKLVVPPKKEELTIPIASEVKQPEPEPEKKETIIVAEKPIEKALEIIPDPVVPEITEKELKVEVSVKQEAISQSEPKSSKMNNPGQKGDIKPKTEILAEKFESKSFLNETLAKFKNSQDLSSKYQHTPIKDIFSALSLNDRFLFIKELFDNDADLFQKTIEILNSSGGFNQAVQYLDVKFKWDLNEPMVQKLLELVHRRYISYE